MASQFGDPRLDRLYRYWWEKRAGRPAPRRCDLQPTEIPDLLPILNLIDVTGDPLTFRHRLVGTEIVDWLERDATGKLVAEGLYGNAADEIVASLGRIAAEVRPFRRRARLSWHRRDWLTMESVELPYVDEIGKTVLILRGSSFSITRYDFPERMEFLPLDAPEGP